MSAPVTRTARLSFSSRYDYVIFPVSYADLKDALTTMGFALSGPRLIGGPVGFTMEPVGIIARKDQLNVAFEPDRQIISVTGTSLPEVTQAFLDLELRVGKNFNPSLEAQTRFLEVIAQFEAETGRSPLQSIEAIRRGSNLWDRFDKILGISVAPFSTRLVSRGLDPNQEEWLDISIEPQVTKANQQYVVNVVYRSRERKKVIDFVETLESKVASLLTELEQPSISKS